MMRARSRNFVVIALTVNWLITISGVFFVFVKLVGWPNELTLILLGPVAFALVPLSYPLALAGNERFARGGDLWLPTGALLPTVLFGILIGPLCASFMWFTLGVRSGSYVTAAVSAFVGFSVAFGLIRLGMSIVASVRNSEVDQPQPN